MVRFVSSTLSNPSRGFYRVFRIMDFSRPGMNLFTEEFSIIRVDYSAGSTSSCVLERTQHIWPACRKRSELDVPVILQLYAALGLAGTLLNDEICCPRHMGPATELHVVQAEGLHQCDCLARGILVIQFIESQYTAFYQPLSNGFKAYLGWLVYIKVKIS